MKRTLLTTVVVCASICAASAQDQKAATTSNAPVAKEVAHKTHDSKHAREWQEKLVTELKLTDEQSQKIAELNKAFAERRQSIENNTTMSEEAKNERKMVMKKAQEAQLLKILTPEQQARYKELVDARTMEAKKD